MDRPAPPSVEEFRAGVALTGVTARVVIANIKSHFTSPPTNTEGHISFSLLRQSVVAPGTDRGISVFRLHSWEFSMSCSQ
jgi:hypothetical protein